MPRFTEENEEVVHLMHRGWIQERNGEETIDVHAPQVRGEKSKTMMIVPGECYNAGSENTTIYSALQGDCCICLDTHVGRSEDQGACKTVCPGRARCADSETGRWGDFSSGAQEASWNRWRSRLWG